MNTFKLAVLFSLSLLISGCATVEARVSSMHDWKICHLLADMTYKAKSQWLWHLSKEIKRRNLTENKKCKSIYEARLAVHVRKRQNSTIQITSGQVPTSRAPLTFEKAISN